MLKILIRLVISATIITVALPFSTRPSFAAEPTMSEILSGKTIPSTIAIKELTPEWRVFRTTGQFDLGSAFQAQIMVGNRTFGTSYYTKGQTITLTGETYMIAYGILDRPEKITDETILELALLNIRTMGSLTNIHSFNLETEIALLEKQLQNTKSMFTRPNTPAKIEPAVPIPTKSQPKRRS